MAKAKILVIDDDRVILELLNLSLGKADFEVISAQDGEAGIEAFKQKKPDLVIADIAMPGIDGYQVVTQIRGMDVEGTRTPIIILTAHEQSVMREYAQEIGADLYLTKPVTTRQLIDKIQELMKPPGK
jgi:two-component system alkaline phosphatase synthesis response regulator PhoP